MSRTLEEIEALVSPAVRQRAADRAAEIMAKIDDVQPLRLAIEKTQTDIAERLHRFEPVAVSIEGVELFLSTLRTHVESVGGSLSLVVSFPGKPDLRIKGLRDIASDGRLIQADETVTNRDVV